MQLGPHFHSFSFIFIHFESSLGALESRCEVKTTYLLSTAAVAGYLAREDGKSRELGQHGSYLNQL